MLAIVDCFKKWRRYLEGAKHQVQVFTDHNNLELFMTTKILNRQEARWAEELAGYDFQIFFRPGKLNGKADYFSRRPEYRQKEEGNGDNAPQPILKPTNFGAPRTTCHSEESETVESNLVTYRTQPISDSVIRLPEGWKPSMTRETLVTAATLPIFSHMTLELCGQCLGQCDPEAVGHHRVRQEPRCGPPAPVGQARRSRRPRVEVPQMLGPTPPRRTSS